VVLLYQADYWRRGALALAALAVAGLVLLQQFGTVENRFASGLIDPGDGRNFYWAAAEKIFHSHVLWGAGPGSFRYLYPMTASLYAQVEPTNAHNDYLNTLCEWGLAGFALVIAALGLLFAGVTRIWPYVRRGSGDLGAKDSSRAAFVLGATLGLLSISIHSLVDFNMQIPANAITAIVLMALLSAHWRFGTERFWFNPGKFGKPLLALAAAAAAWFLASEGLREQSEFHWLKQARNQTLPFSGRIAALETAQKIEPRNFMTCCQLGETYRIEAWRGETGNEELARQGLQWFQRGQDLNPYNCQPPLGIGLCLDWLDRPHEATRYFLQALEVNPNNAVVQWKLAWHCMVLRNYPLARFWLERSLYWVRTPEALAYFEIVNEKLAEEAAHPPPPGRE
jgi:tetratricopeptide (TPR) repeat protein